MRAFLAILALAALVALSVGGPPAEAFIRLPSIKNKLIELALGQISSPGSFEVTAEEIEDLEGGVTSLVDVKISDGEGVWLSLDRLNFAWEPGKLVGGELSITELRLIGLDVSRPPSSEAEPPELKPQEPWQQSPFDWPRAPISVTVEGFQMENAFIAEGVLPQALRFDAEGRALDKGDLQEVALSLRRTDDVDGQIDFLLRRDFAEETLRLDLSAREAPGGLVAAAAGLPGDAPARLELNAQGPIDDWRLTFDMAVERVLEAGGEATFDYSDRLNAVADFTVTPGPGVGPELAAVLGAEARLEAEIVERPDGIIEVVRGRLASPALRATASGALATGPEGESDLAVSLVAEAPLADLVEGVAFERFSFDGQVTGAAGSLAAEGELGLAGLMTAPADIGTLALEGRVAQTGDGVEFDLAGQGEGLRIDQLGPEVIGPARLEAAGDLSGDLLTLRRAALESDTLTAEASGTYDLAAATGALDARLSAPEIAPVAAAYGVEAEGGVSATAGLSLSGETFSADLSATLEGFDAAAAAARRLALSGTVSSGPDSLAFNMTGESEGLRIDQLGPGVLGEARLAAAGTLEGDLLTLSEGELSSRVLTAGVSGTYDLADASGALSLSVSAPDIGPVAAVYDVAIEGAVAASAEVALGAEAIEAHLAATLDELAMEGVAAGSFDLTGRVSSDPDRIAFDIEGEGTGLRIDRIGPDAIGPARLEVAGELSGELLTLRRAALESETLTAGASGTYDLAGSTGDIELRLAAPDIAPMARAYGVEAEGGLSVTVGLDLSGETYAADLSAALEGFEAEAAAARRLALSGTVSGDPARIAFDIEGAGEGLRIDRIGPDVIGEARLAAAGTLEGDLLTLSEGELGSQALTVDVSGTYDLAETSGALRFSASAPEIAPVAAAYDVAAEGAMTASAELAVAPETIEANLAATLAGFETEAAGARRLAVTGTVSGGPDDLAFDIEGKSEGLRLGRDTIGPAQLDIAGDLSGDLLTLRRAALEAEILSAEVSGTYDLAASTGDLKLRLAAPDIGPLAGAYGVEAEGAVSASADVDVRADRVEADFSAALERFESEAAAARRLALSGTATGTPDRAAFDISGEGAGLRIDRIGPDVIGDARLAAAGTLEGGLLTLREADLTSKALTLDASGSYDLAEGSGTLSVGAAAPELGPVAAAYDVDLAAGMKATAEVTLGPETVEANLSASLDGLAMQGVTADTFTLAGRAAGEPDRVAFDLGGEAVGLTLEGVPDDLTRGLSYAARGTLAGSRLELAEARVTSPLAAAEASGSVALDAGTLALDYAVESGDLAPLARVFGVDAAGALDAEGRVEGPFDALGLDGAARLGDAAFQGQSYGRVTLDHDVTIGPAPEGRLDVSLAGSWLGDAGAATRFRLDGQTLTLADLEARLLGTALAGRAKVDLGTTLIDATLDVAISDLRPAGRFAGAELAGAAEGQVTLAATGGRQDLRATLAATNLATGGATIGRADITLGATGIFGTPAIDLDVEAAGVAAGPVTLETATVAARGPLGGLEFSAEGRGTLRDDPLDAALAGRANLAGTPLAVTLARAEVTAAEDTLRLEQPLSLRLGGGVVAAEGLALALPEDGRVAGDVALRPGGYTGELAIERLSLAAVGRWTGAAVTGGRVDASATFDTRRGRAGADISARARGVSSEAAVGQSVDADIEARWDGTRLESRAEVRGDFGEPFRARLALPLRPGAGGVPTLPGSGELDGSLTWRGRILDVWAIVPAAGHLLDGQADIDLTLTGTVDAPRVSGRAEIREGQYQNLDAGTILTGLTLDTAISEGRTIEVTLAATDGARGEVRADAAIRLGAEPPALELTATADRAVLVRRDDVTAALSGEVALEGPFTELELTGGLTVDEAEVRLVNATPPEVVTLDGIRIKGEPEPDEEDAGESIVNLYLSIAAERDIFVRGRGLDSEWRMDLAVTGTAARPVVSGTIEKVRGQLSLIGKTFQLERGRITFDGGREVDPLLDIYFQAEDHGIRGGVVVEGRASDPELGFSSTPALPEGEIMPRLLFGQSRQSLTAGQGIQLATGLARLMGGGTGPLDTVRQTVGLDVLRVGGESVEEAEVTVGRNIGENVFIGAEQGLGGEGSAVTVEVEVFGGVTVDTEVGADGTSNIGITLKKDF